MEDKFKKPKSFGEILDLTFNLSKNRFKEFFTILLILNGPVYLIEAIVQLLSGTSFFREVGTGNTWVEKIAAGFEGTANNASINGDIGIIVVAFIGFFLFPVSEASILLAIDHIRKNEEFTPGSVIKLGFSRFWPMLVIDIVFGLIAFGIVIVPTIIVVLTGVFGSMISPFLGIPLAILLFLGLVVGVGYLLTRWSFYFGWLY